MSKDFGPVSGYLDPANKSWEQVTWETNRPPLDKEFNLFGELFLRRLFRSEEMPSGFLMSRDYFSPDIFPKTNTGVYAEEPGNYRDRLPAGVPSANTFYFGPGQVAKVENMPVYVRSKTSEWTAITLNAAPSGVAVKRFDLVFLEVWRAGLTADAATDTANGIRDSNGKIFYNGWKDSPTADNFTDDVYDPGVGVETSRRVQVQWRIRVVDGVDLNTYPDGVDDTGVVFAQGPAAAPTASTFTSESSTGDSGLFVSTGHSNIVDGNIWAIPICAVARRNQDTWDKDTNQNGGSGTRPDGLSYDEVVEQDIIDLRKIVSRDWDFDELLQKNMAWLMDGKLKTYWEDTGLGGGERATYFTQADEVGPVDTPGATKIDEFDGYKKQFSDAKVATNCYKIVQLADRTFFTSAVEWKNGDIFDIALPVSSEGIIDVVVEAAFYSGYELLSSHYVTANLNTQTITITLTGPLEADIPAPDRTNVDLYVKIGVSWPGGRGLSRDPREYQQTVVTGANIGVLEAGDNFVYESAVPPGLTALSTLSNFYKPSRTATLIASYTYVSFAIASRTTTTTYLPYDVESVTGIYDAIADPGKTTNLFLGVTGNVITHGAVPATHRAMLVDFDSQQPIQAGDQVTLYYEAPAQQTLDITASGLNVSDVKIHIIHAPSYLYSISAGSGSHRPGYPYICPGSPIPICATGFTGEQDMDYDQPVNVDDFGTDAQFIQLPVHVPLAMIPYFIFTNSGTDQERRHYYNDVSNTAYDDEILGTPVAYQPSVFAKLLHTTHNHKVAYATIGMTVEDTAVGKRGTLLLLVFTQTSGDRQNSVLFDAAGGGDACVAIYRLKGNPTVSARKRQLGYTLIEV